MSGRLLETVEVETGAQPTASIVWLHGVGADGHQFEPLIGPLTRAASAPLRFVLPHAPVRRITLCNGEQMRGWYDLRNPDRQIGQDEAAIRASDAAIGALLRRERARGIPFHRIVLGGFSQGASMALYAGPRFPERLAAVVALSGYRLIASTLQAEWQEANRKTPFFLGHGTADPVVSLKESELARDLLRRAGYAVEWHAYPAGHEVPAEEIAAIADFLGKIL